jgi:hypothetical protein
LEPGPEAAFAGVHDEQAKLDWRLLVRAGLFTGRAVMATCGTWDVAGPAGIPSFTPEGYSIREWNGDSHWDDVPEPAITEHNSVVRALMAAIGRLTLGNADMTERRDEWKAAYEKWRAMYEASESVLRELIEALPDHIPGKEEGPLLVKARALLHSIR